ncbi:G-alpha-domain-containing protein [Trametes versicolor FP-101664 SS1]|uniref:G-alpha-domain-containing protein n=1 Tax=Trametes versicolor (strain FP-101664) TaxID=717944 RepID=UPI0004621D28|nr:G-alpha-domain-containing protein [Trametes versicolor FP-101664 SS1]EIW55473.1 G-alpha-domain-containing protein [Trametes versicolor FP-101664 SS1]
MNGGLSALNCYRPGSSTDLDDDGGTRTPLPEASTSGRKRGPAAAHPQENVWPPWPPRNESELDKAARLEEEREAKRVSDAIDRALESERQALRRPRRGDMKLLLLGQSESGKSTLLKNFQIQFAPAALRAESAAWRAVVHLNLVRAVNFMLDVLTQPSAAPAPGLMQAGDASPTVTAFSHRISMTPQPNSDLRRFKLALSPLRQVEMILARHLSADEASGAVPGEKDAPAVHRRRAGEVTIRGGHTWKALLQQKQEPEEGRSRYSEGLADDMENARYILDACRKDVVAMWTSTAVQGALREEGVLVEDQAHFFLDHAERVMQSSYEPTFDDILRARLQTMGVEEHHLIMETGAENGQHWIFYDVGGARGQRESWVPFFDHVNAIIFLCSTAGFNEVLVEDRAINRLMDSFNAWKTVCSSPLLASVQFILLLNKTDLLDARLKSGMQFSTYVESYKGENDSEHVTDYLKRKLAAIHRHHSPQQRKLHVHCTCAIDIDNTSPILMRIRDTILVNHLAAVQLI